MANIMVRPATIHDVRAIISDGVRDADALECKRAGFSVEKGITRSFELSTVCRVAVLDGKIIAIWGVGGDIIGTMGRPWLFTAPGIEKYPLWMVKEGRKQVGEMLELYGRLLNFVDAEYAGALAFVKILGFSVGEPRAVFSGPDLFCKIERKR